MLRRLITAIGGISLILCGVASPLPAQALPTDEAATIRVGTFNVNAAVPVDRWTQAYSDFADLVDVGVMQEATSWKKARAMSSRTDVGSFRPENYAQNPIFWKTARFQFVAGLGKQLSGARVIEDKVTGKPYAQRANIATVVRLVDLQTGQPVSVVNVHLLSGAVRNGVPTPGQPKRYRLYLEQVRTLAALAAEERALPATVFVLGDFNLNYRWDKRVKKKRFPVYQLQERALRACWGPWRELEPGRGSGSRAGSYLDAVWSSTRAQGLKVHRGRAFRNLSDHYPVVARYEPESPIPLP